MKQRIGCIFSPSRDFLLFFSRQRLDLEERVQLRLWLAVGATDTVCPGEVLRVGLVGERQAKSEKTLELT